MASLAEYQNIEQTIKSLHERYISERKKLNTIIETVDDIEKQLEKAFSKANEISKSITNLSAQDAAALNHSRQSIADIQEKLRARHNSEAQVDTLNRTIECHPASASKLKPTSRI